MKVGFLGAGRLAVSLAEGFIAAGVSKADTLLASCPPSDTWSVEHMTGAGVKVINDNKELVKQSPLVILAVKPKVFPLVLPEIRDVVTPQHTLVSVAMGITTKAIEKVLPEGSRVIRVMPNVGAIARKSASVVSPGSSAKKADVETVINLFKAVGWCEEMDEESLDVVTGLSSCGTAYVMMVIEALADGAVLMGMSRDVAYRLAAQTVAGSGELALKTNLTPAVLKDMVTSPGGSTIRGMFALEQKGVRGAFMAAVKEATEKSRSVSKKE